MKKTMIYELTTCGLMAAVMCIAGPLSIPIGPIPVSLTNFVIYLTVFLLGTKGTSVSFLIYLLLGAVGLPVFSGYAGGLGKLAGPTGGYLIGFLFMAIISGIVMEKSKANLWITMVGMIVATAVDYFFGTAWFVLQAKCTVAYAVSVCILPFVLVDLAKIVIACVVGKQIRKILTKANIITVQE